MAATEVERRRDGHREAPGLEQGRLWLNAWAELPVGLLFCFTATCPRRPWSGGTGRSELGQLADRRQRQAACRPHEPWRAHAR